GKVETLCREAVEFKFASVCIPPYYLDLAQSILNEENEVKLCTVIGFPLGYESTKTKVFAVNEAIAKGADELDVVINVAAIKNAEWDYLDAELNDLSVACHKSGKILKIIFETCYLSDEEVEKLAVLCAKNQVDYVKTSTGFGTAGATVHHIGLMKKGVAGKCKIKASGGIRTWKDAEQMIKAGVHRIGASSSIQILEEFLAVSAGPE
ncbi:MAG TPA: deoxyribose-phosphate aldolase, partial [Saprospirales bacterium]|nr:deoxyribose-phosphate aldolase [Saprospirales bacterium]